MTEVPVILLHGTNAAPWTMEKFRAFFEEKGFDCQAPTYRFHDMPDGQERDAALANVSIADYVSDISEIIEKLDRRPIVIGHSLGGLITQILAGRGLIEAGVLINSSIINGTFPTSEAERRLGKLFMSSGSFWETAPGLSFELISEFGLNTMPEAQQREIFSRLQNESGRVLFELFFWMFDVHQTTSVKFDQMNTRMLFLSGEKDLAIPPLTARQMAARYGNLATFYEFEGRCHYMQLEENWRELAERTYEWIGKVVSR